MTKRSLFMTLAGAALLSLAFASPSQAASTLVTTTADFFVTGGGTAADLEIAYNPSGLAINNLTLVSAGGLTGASISTFGDTVRLDFNPASSASGIVFTFVTDAAPALVGVFSFQLTGLAGDVTASGVNVAITAVSQGVPEPASLALLGIGMTGLLAFRRYFKRPAVA